MPLGLRNLGAYGLGYTAQAYAYVLLLTDRYPNSDPEAIGPAWELPPHPVRLELDDDGRRSRADGLLPAPARDPPLRLAGALDDRGVPRRDRERVRRARPRPLGGCAAPVPRRLRALLRARDRVRHPRREPVPRLRRHARATRSTSRSTRRSARTAGSRSSAPSSRSRPSSSPARSASCSFVIGFLGWFAALATGRMPTGLRNLGAFAVRYLSQTNAYWFVVTDAYPHASPALRPPPEPEPEPTQSEPPAARSRRRSDEPRAAARAVVLLVLAGLWAVAAWSLWQSVVPDDLVLGRRLAGRDSAARRSSGPTATSSSSASSSWSRSSSCSASLVRLRQVRDPLREGVGGRPDRHRDAARDDRARARLDLAGAVPPRGGLVGPALRPDRQRLPRDALRELVRSSARSSCSSASRWSS